MLKYQEQFLLRLATLMHRTSINLRCCSQKTWAYGDPHEHSLKGPREMVVGFANIDASFASPSDVASNVLAKVNQSPENYKCATRSISSRTAVWINPLTGTIQLGWLDSTTRLINGSAPLNTPSSVDQGGLNRSARIRPPFLEDTQSLSTTETVEGWFLSKETEKV